MTIRDTNDIYKSEDVLSLDNDNNVIIKFPNKNQFSIPAGNFSQFELDSISKKEFCNGCYTISSKGYYGTKHNWCKLSRLIANYC